MDIDHWIWINGFLRITISKQFVREFHTMLKGIWIILKAYMYVNVQWLLPTNLLVYCSCNILERSSPLICSPYQVYLILLNRYS